MYSTKIFHIKTNNFPLQIVRYFNNFAFMSEKRDVYGRFLFLDHFVSVPDNCLKNLSATANATRSVTRILLRGRELEPKVNSFSTQTV